MAEHIGLSAPFVLEYVYKRSLGPVVGRFCASLREGRIEGIRTRSGRVLCPPAEYDPESGETLTEFVQVGPGGTVLTWAWVSAPRHNHPLDRPFAWALVRLDGADTGMLHVVDAGTEERMAAGMRVSARFRDQRGAGIRDIECFVPAHPHPPLGQGSKVPSPTSGRGNLAQQAPSRVRVTWSFRRSRPARPGPARGPSSPPRAWPWSGAPGRPAPCPARTA